MAVVTVSNPGQQDVGRKRKDNREKEKNLDALLHKQSKPCPLGLPPLCILRDGLSPQQKLEAKHGVSYLESQHYEV